MQPLTVMDDEKKLYHVEKGPNNVLMLRETEQFCTTHSSTSMIQHHSTTTVPVGGRTPSPPPPDALQHIRDETARERHLRRLAEEKVSNLQAQLKDTYARFEGQLSNQGNYLSQVQQLRATCDAKQREVDAIRRENALNAQLLQECQVALQKSGIIAEEECHKIQIEKNDEIMSYCNKIAKLMDELKEERERYAALAADIKDMGREVQPLRLLVTEKESIITSLRSEVHQTLETITELTSRNTSLGQQSNQQSTRLSELEHQLKQAQLAAQRANNNLEELRQDQHRVAAEQQSQICRLQQTEQELITAHSQKGALNARIQELQQDTHRKQQEAAELKRQLELTLRSKEETSTLLIQLKVEKEAETLNLRESLNKKTAECDQCMHNITALQQESHQLKLMQDHLHQQLAKDGDEKRMMDADRRRFQDEALRLEKERTEHQQRAHAAEASLTVLSAERQSSNQKIIMLNNELKENKGQLHKMQAENTLLTEQLNRERSVLSHEATAKQNLNTELEKMRWAKEDSDSNATKLAHEIANLKNELINAHGSIDNEAKARVEDKLSYEQRLLMLQNSAKADKEVLQARMLADIDDLQHRLTDATKQHADFRAVVAEKDDTIANITHERNMLQDRIVQFETERHQVVEERTRMTEHTRIQIDTIESQLTETTTRKQLLEDEVHKRDNDIAHLKKMLAETQAGNERLTSQLQQASSDYNHELEHRTDLTRTLNALKSQISSLVGRSNLLEDQVQNAKTKELEASEGLSLLQSQLQQANIADSIVRRENEEAKMELEKLKSAYTMSQQEVNHARELYNQAKHDWDSKEKDLTERLTALCDQLSDANTNKHVAKKLSDKNDHLTSKMAGLMEAIQQKKDEATAYSTECGRLRNLAAKLEGEIAMTERKHDTIWRECVVLRENNNNYQLRVETLQTEVQASGTDKMKDQEQLAALQKQLKLTQMQLDEKAQAYTSLLQRATVDSENAVMLRTQLDQVKSERELVERQRGKAWEEKSGLEAENIQLRSQNAEYQTEIDSYKLIETKYNQIQKTNEQLTKQLSQLKETRSIEIQECHHKIESSEIRQAAITSELNNLATEKIHRDEESKQLKGQLVKLNAENSELQRKYTALTREHEDGHTNSSLLQQEVIKLRHKLDELEQAKLIETSDLSKKAAKLERELHHTTESVSECRRAAESDRGTLSQEVASHGLTRRLLEEKSHKVKDITDLNEKLSIELEEKNRELNLLRKTVKDAQLKMNVLDNELSMREANMLRLKEDDTASYLAQIQRLEAEREHDRRKIQDLENNVLTEKMKQVGRDRDERSMIERLEVELQQTRDNNQTERNLLHNNIQTVTSFLYTIYDSLKDIARHHQSFDATSLAINDSTTQLTGAIDHTLQAKFSHVIAILWQLVNRDGGSTAGGGRYTSPLRKTSPLALTGAPMPHTSQSSRSSPSPTPPGGLPNNLNLPPGPNNVNKYNYTTCDGTTHITRSVSIERTPPGSPNRLGVGGDTSNIGLGDMHHLTSQYNPGSTPHTNLHSSTATHQQHNTLYPTTTTTTDDTTTTTTTSHIQVEDTRTRTYIYNKT